MADRRGTAIRPWALALLLATATVGLYAPVADHGFIGYDDPGYVTANAHVRAGLTAEGVAWAFTTWDQGNWHPLTWLSHMLDVSLFGVRPGPQHLMSAALHGVAAGLLLLALASATRRPWPATVVAALFAAHPLHVESVAWVAERKDVLSALLAWATILAWVGWARRGGSLRYALALALYAAGLMAKPMLVTLPVLLVLLDVWPLGRSGPAAPAAGGWRGALRRSIVEKLPFFALAAASAVVTLVAQRAGGALKDAVEFPLGLRLANAAVGAATYLRRAVWPDDLAFFHPYPTDVHPLALAASVALIAGLVALGWRQRRRRPWIGVGVAWYLVTLLPVLGLVQVGTQSTADRYAYIPLVGLWIAVVWTAADPAPAGPAVRRLRAAAAIAVLLACAVLTRHTLRFWRDSETLYRRALAVTTDNYVAEGLLGLELARAGRVGEAESHYREAVRMRPGFAVTRNNLGVLLADTGRFDEAIAEYRAALDARPGYTEAYNNLAIALASTGRLDEAADLLRRALTMRPGNPEAALNLSLVERRRGELVAAVDALRTAVDLRPDWRDEALELAWLLATAPAPAARDGEEAARRAAALCEQRDDARCLDVLAAAYAELGRFEDAVAAAARAAAAAGEEGRPELARAIAERGAAYARGAPWRAP